jgi:hypothetical protein
MKPNGAPVLPSDVPHNIRIATTTQSPLASLHRLLSELYCPMLGLGGPAHDPPLAGPAAAAAVQLPPQLQELLLQVVAGLGSAARADGVAAMAVADVGPGGMEAAASAGVLKALDELDAWVQAAAGPPGGRDGGRSGGEQAPGSDTRAVFPGLTWKRRTGQVAVWPSLFRSQPCLRPQVLRSLRRIRYRQSWSHCASLCRRWRLAASRPSGRARARQPARPRTRCRARGASATAAAAAAGQ